MNPTKSEDRSAGERRTSDEGLSLRTRIIIMLLAASILPLAVVGAGAGIVFGGMLEDKALNLQRCDLCGRL